MKCPNCKRYTELEFGLGEFDGEYAWQVVTCEECGYQFHSVYEFAFFEDRDTGKEIEVED